MEQLSKLLPGVLNLEHPKHVPKPSETGEQSEINKFVDARNDAVIKYAPVERLNEALRLSMLKVGLRAASLPSEAETYILIEHIIANYGNHTVTEIKLAFDLAITGKLNLESSEVTCYENFSCLYFSKIMNAYREYASRIHKEVKPVVKELPPVELTENEMFEWVDHTKRQFEKGKITFNLLPVILYEFLYKKNLIKPGLEIWESAKKKRISEIQNELCNPHCEKDKLAAELKYLNSGVVNKENPFHLPARLIAQRLSIVDFFKIE